MKVRESPSKDLNRKKKKKKTLMGSWDRCIQCL